MAAYLLDAVTVHPHVCGEHASSPAKLAQAHGSSPRVWGTCRQCSRFGGYCGSSPRVWGTCGCEARRQSITRFIPTCVGNIEQQYFLPGLGSVHPHVCGEHEICYSSVCLCVRFIPTCVGNMHPPPPPARWQSVHPHVCGEHLSVASNSGGTWTVHPHVCGEHPARRSRGWDTAGSSPRVWGT